jgi:hypothetical protein
VRSDDDTGSPVLDRRLGQDDGSVVVSRTVVDGGEEMEVELGAHGRRSPLCTIVAQEAALSMS